MMDEKGKTGVGRVGGSGGGGGGGGDKRGEGEMKERWVGGEKP